MFTRSITSLAVAALLASGCGGSVRGPAASTAEDGKGDQIQWWENPINIVGSDPANYLLANNIGSDDVGRTFGVDDAHVPWPDTYWPWVDGGSDARWQGGDIPSPVEKYMSVLDPAETADAKSWEQTRHGPQLPGVLDWMGHCPGWTGASMTEPMLQHAVWAKSDGNGNFVACAEGDAGCIKFEIGDVNALEAETYVDAQTILIGDRCDTPASQIERDAYGRIVRAGRGCQGLNAGALVLVLGNLMKKQHRAFAIDAQNGYNTDQIWNQPAYRYRVYRYDVLSEAEAANLVASGLRTGTQTKYQWNDKAKGFAFADLGILWVSERGPNYAPVSGLDSTRETRMTMVIETDRDARDPAAQIIGGEFLDDPSVGADRLTVAPFVWVVTGPAWDGLPTWVGGNNSHNPYIKPSKVKQLVALGAR